MAPSPEAVSRSSSTETTKPFELTERQAEANRLLASPARHILLRGGSRSGKTFLLMRAITVRALKAEKIELFSSSKLQPALRLYERYGFQHIPLEDSPFETADVKMVLIL